MVNHVKKMVVRLPFETVLDQLKTELHNDGFEIGGITDFHNAASRFPVTHVKHKVLAIYHGFLHKEMLLLAPFAGLVLPCSVSVIEWYPGETAIVPYNATEHIAREMSLHSLENIAREVSRRLDDVIQTLENAQSKDRDFVTSWG